jgi:cellulose synthase/poly-beta-1,6-N-acetylglucosamine synthase-like glycosyltransferase
MVVFIVIMVLLMIMYLFIMLTYRHWFLKLKVYQPQQPQPSINFTIIIPARNEAANIGNCVSSILQQNYPSELYEIIVIDDHSTDETAAIVQALQASNNNIQLIQLADIVFDQPLNSYKKKAIETAIGRATNDWIVTTDADCVAQTNWLALYNDYIVTNEVVFVGAPVVFTNDGSVLAAFQCIDFMALQGITAASVSAGFHAMCNGANLAFKKTVFYAVEGYKHVDKIASGDDMFLMNKIQNKYPKRIGFLYHPQAVIATLPMPTVRSFLNQRIRWASKTNSYQDIRIVVILWAILILNIGQVLMPLLVFWQPTVLWYWLGLLATKTFVEALFALDIAAFFKIKLRAWHLLLQFPHIVYTAMAGTFGLFGNYQWKGRTVK